MALPWGRQDFAERFWAAAAAGNGRIAPADLAIQDGRVDAAALAAALRNHSPAAPVRPGYVRITGFTIAGILPLAGIQLTYNLLFERCRFEDGIDAIGLKGSTFGFIGCHLAGGLDARDMVLERNLLLRNGFVSEGPVLVRDAAVDGFVDCQRASFLFNGADPPGRMPEPLAEQHFGHAFGASRMRAGTLWWSEVTVGDGVIGLRDVTVDVFRDDLAAGPQSWPEGGSYELSNFRFTAKNPASAAQHQRWLTLDAAAERSGARTLAAALETAGESEQAHRILLWARRRRTDGLAGVGKWLRWSYLALLALSFRPLAALGLFLAMYLLAVGMVELCWMVDLIRPTATAVTLNVCYVAVNACHAPGWGLLSNWRASFLVPLGFGAFDPWSYALGLLFPYVPGDPTADWGPVNAALELVMMLVRAGSVALQAAIAWNMLGRRDLR